MTTRTTRVLTVALVAPLIIAGLAACSSSGDGAVPKPTPTRTATVPPTPSPTTGPPTPSPTQTVFPTAAPTTARPSSTPTTARPTATSTPVVQAACNTLTFDQLRAVTINPTARPTNRDITCVMDYLYQATQLSAGPIKVVSVFVNHRPVGTPATWGQTVTTTWDGNAGLIHAPSDLWLPDQYFDMNGNVGSEPSNDYNRSVSSIAALYHATGTSWPKLSWSWKKSGSNITWTFSFKQPVSPKTITATFDRTGYPTGATSFEHIENEPAATLRVTESIGPYTGPPIDIH